MKLALSVLIVALGASALASPISSVGQPPIQVNPNQDPAVTAQCFNTYMPILQEVANIFSTQYQACVTVASQQITNLTTTAQQNRTQFVQDTNAVCAGFQTCQNETDLMNFFDCYSAASSQDVSQVYTISTNAAIAATTFSQGLKTIQDNQATCTKNTERTYVNDTAQTYEKLDSCLQNGLPVTNTPSTTEAAKTTGPVATTAAANTKEIVNTFVKTQCSDAAGTRTQTSADGSQTQTQTGPGCQSQSSDSGSSSQSQSDSGSQSQSECSGSDCVNMPPMEPMKPFAPFKPMLPMQPMQLMQPMLPMRFD